MKYNRVRIVLGVNTLNKMVYLYTYNESLLSLTIVNIIVLLLLLFIYYLNNPPGLTKIYFLIFIVM